MSLPNKTRLVVFDVDGTIVDARELIIQSTQLGLKRSGLSIPPESEILENVGISLIEVVRNIYPKLGKDIQEAAANQIKLAFSDVRRETGGERMLKPINGFYDLVALLRSRSVALAVASGKPMHSLEFALQALNVSEKVDTYISTEQYGGKPNPEALHYLLQYFNVEASETVYVGDTIMDYKFAANAGCRFVGVAWGYHGAERLLSSGVQSVIYCFDELERYL